MKSIRRLILISAVFALLCLFFYLFGTPSKSKTTGIDSAATLEILDGESVITMTLADYLPGVLAGEVPASFEAEALKAQAVAARTYVLASHKHENARVCTDSQCCLAYRDIPSMKSLWGEKYDEYATRIHAAVADTDGEYLRYEGEPIQAVFHASSAGNTEDSAALWSSLPYLVSVSTPETAETVPGLTTTVTMSPEVLAHALSLDPKTSPEAWLEGIRLDDAGRVKGLLLCGQAFTGPYIRTTLDLRSTDFTLEWTGTEFRFTVMGNGHGIGMSQYGANLLAASGWSYRDILAHYYPGTALAS